MLIRTLTILSLLILGIPNAVVGFQGDIGPLLGDSYFIAPGAGTENGFQLAGGPFENSTINGEGELIGPDFGGGMILSSDSLTQNIGNNFDLVFRLETIGGNLLPNGIIGDSGSELNSLGIFVGSGIDPVELAAPVVPNTAIIEAFNTSGQSIGTIDVIDFANFSVGLGGGWDGTFGLNFVDQIPVGDVGAVELQINFNAVPEPASAGLLGVVGLAYVSVRRRKQGLIVV